MNPPGATAMTIYAALLTAAKEGLICPSHSELAAVAGVSVFGIYKRLKELSNAGMIEVIVKGRTRVIKVGKWSTAPLVMPPPPVPVEGWDRNAGPGECRKWVAMFEAHFGDEPVFSSHRVKPEGRLVINVPQTRTMGGVQSYGG